MNPFPVSWSELTLHDVIAFLSDAVEEPLTWEAKGGGGEPSKKAMRKSVSGFANSRAGGCLLLGVVAHHVVDRRLIGGRPLRLLWRRRVL